MKNDTNSEIDNSMIDFFSNLKERGTCMETLIYSRHQQTAEDIRILKRHVDELNELFVSGQAAEDAERMEQRGCGKAKRNNLLWEEQEPTGKINEKEGTCGNLKNHRKSH